MATPESSAASSQELLLHEYQAEIGRLHAYVDVILGERDALKRSLEAAERDYARLQAKLAEYDKYVGEFTRHA